MVPSVQLLGNSPIPRPASCTTQHGKCCIAARFISHRSFFAEDQINLIAKHEYQRTRTRTVFSGLRAHDGIISSLHLPFCHSNRANEKKRIQLILLLNRLAHPSESLREHVQTKFDAVKGKN